MYIHKYIFMFIAKILVSSPTLGKEVVNKMSFANKVVIVTGASSGIGAATAKMFAKEKAKVAIIGRNTEKLNSVSADIKRISGTDPLVIVADVSKDDEARGIVEKTIKHYGKLDVLVNNAGIAIRTSILSEDYVESFDKIHATDLRGVVIITNAAVSHLIKTKGNIINISSVASTQPSATLSAYCTAKAGLDHFSRSIAAELASKGVRVNIVNPGPVKTDIIMTMGFTKEQSDKMWEDSKSQMPLGFVSESEEVGDLILFLASDKARSITGSDYTIDVGVKLFGQPKEN